MRFPLVLYWRIAEQAQCSPKHQIVYQYVTSTYKLLQSNDFSPLVGRF